MSISTRRKNWRGFGEAVLSITTDNYEMTRQIETDDFIYTRTETMFQKNGVLTWDDMEWRALAWFYLETQNDI